MYNNEFSPEVLKSVEDELASDPQAKRIDEVKRDIEEQKMKLAYLEAELSVLKNSRKESITIRWRDSIKWCLEVDAKNPFFFLKNSAGVAKCISFKHKIDITGDIKNKIATTLSMMFKEGLIGRVMHNGSHHYGLIEFFNKDLETLKSAHKGNVDKLKSI